MEKKTDKKEVKLITLNIEGDNHLKRVVKFIKAEKPDVLCLQEVFETDIPFLENALGKQAIFAPNVRILRKNNSLLPSGLWGIAIFTENKPKEILRRYYATKESYVPALLAMEKGLSDEQILFVNRVVLAAEIIKNNVDFNIATTHFTWSPKGKATPLQQKHLDKIFAILNGFGEFVLCGDFNAPRGGEIYKRLSKKYTDNVPKSVKSTIDAEFHRIKNLKLVVDGIFTTPLYKVRDVRVVGGVSDHRALVGIVRKV